MLRHSDSVEDITFDLGGASMSSQDINDLDLDKELGLDQPSELHQPRHVPNMHTSFFEFDNLPNHPVRKPLNILFSFYFVNSAAQ